MSKTIQKKAVTNAVMSALIKKREASKKKIAERTKKSLEISIMQLPSARLVRGHIRGAGSAGYNSSAIILTDKLTKEISESNKVIELEDQAETA